MNSGRLWTFAHTIYTLVIYLVWWNKPLDVEEPVQLRVASALGYQIESYHHLILLIICSRRV